MFVDKLVSINEVAVNYKYIITLSGEFRKYILITLLKRHKSP